MKTIDLNNVDIDRIIRDHYPEFTGVHPACSAVPMCSQQEFDGLVESIRECGLREDLLRTKDKQLLDGRTRLLACYVAGVDIRVKTDSGTVDPWMTVKVANVDRRHMTVGQLAIFGLAWKQHEEEEAKKRQTLSKGRGRKGKETFPDLNKDSGQSRDKAGERVGVSGKSIDKAGELEENAPDLFSLVKEGKESLESAHKKAKARQKAISSLPSESAPKATLENKNVATIITPSGESKSIPLPNKVVFNQTNQSVDWAAWTWNPVTGCHHGCPFCYAREIAHKDQMRPYYPNKFEPTFHEYRLAAPANTSCPTTGNDRSKRVFVCSMADLFGTWVPKEWISKVFEACLGSPQWEYIFLTKWPKRYSSMPLIKKAWYGASIVQQSDVSRVEKSMQSLAGVGDIVRWVSMEPMLEPITFKDLSWCDLVVIGAQTSTYQPEGFSPAFSPQFDWVVDVVNQCRESGVPYFLKANLGLEQPGMSLPKMKPRGCQ